MISDISQLEINYPTRYFGRKGGNFIRRNSKQVNIDTYPTCKFDAYLYSGMH